MIVIAQVASSWTHPKSALHFAHFRWQLLFQPSAINWWSAGAPRRAISQYCFDKASIISVSLFQMRTKRYRTSLQVYCFDEWHSGVAKSRVLIFELYYTRGPSYSLSAFVYQKITFYAGSRAQPINSWPLLRYLSLTDPDPFSNHQIHLLIGADLYGFLLSNDVN